jgi:anti-anti-sigma factor
MSFEINKEDNYVVIKVAAEKLDTIIAPNLKTELVLLDKNGSTNFVIDLSDTKYCDSSGLSALLVGNRLAKASNGCLVLCGLQPAVEKMIQISQLHTVLNITPTLNEAVDYLMMDALEKEVGGAE